MTVTDSKELYQLMISLRAHGWTRTLPRDNLVSKKSDDEFMESFRFVLPGYNLRPLEISGAIGRSQLNKVDAIVDGRRKNAEIFKDLFSGIEGLRIQQEIGSSSWFGFAIVIENGKNRSELVSMLNQAGVEVRPIVAGNFVRNPVIELMDTEKHGSLRVADHIHDSGLFFGNHHYDISEELIGISKIVKSFFE